MSVWSQFEGIVCVPTKEHISLEKALDAEERVNELEWELKQANYESNF